MIVEVVVCILECDGFDGYMMNVVVVLVGVSIGLFY